ncbi:MAG: non-ribosomal peptide synthetase, partial [Bacteroidota bacterium]
MIDYLIREKSKDRGITFISGLDKEDFLSYAELYECALICLHNLQENGMEKGHELILYIDDNKEFLIIFWACLLGGIIPVPVSIGKQQDQKLKVYGIWTSLDDPKMVTNSGLLDSLMRTTAETQTHDTLFDTLRTNSFSVENVLSGVAKGIPVDISEDDIAYIQFSSGSTNTPKGVILTHKNLVANTIDIKTRCAIEPNDSALSWMPLTHDMGLICFHLTSLVAGISQFLIPTGLFIRTPAIWLDKASEHKVTQLYSPNFGYQYFISFLKKDKEMDWDLSHVRLIYNGAEAISHKLCNRFLNLLKIYGLSQEVMHPGYGLAEASVAVCLPIPGTGLRSYNLDRKYLEHGQQVQHLDESDIDAVNFVEVGFPIDHCQLRICDKQDGLLAEETIGDIQIKGDNVTGGYYNNSEATNEVFTEDDWLRTGDLGFLKDGNLIITGRAKNMIIVNGQNYYPQDIERAACELDGIDLGKVVACEVLHHDTSEEKLLLFILFKGRVERFIPVVESVKERLAERIGIVPWKVIPVRTVFKTTSGKIQNFKHIAKFQSGYYNDVLGEIDDLLLKTHKQAGSLKDQLLNICEDLIKDKIHPNDHLLTMGFNSLLITRLIAKLQEQFSVDLSIGQLLNNPTVDQLLMLIQDRTEVNAEHIAKTPEKSSYELSYGQKFVWKFAKWTEDQVGCNLFSANILKGYLNVESLQNAFRLLLERHESL